MDKDAIKKMKSLPLRTIGDMYGFRFEKVGDKYRALCRFHNDTGTPNLFVYPDDSFFCFACRRGGGKEAFVAYAEHMDKKAVEKLWSADTPIEEAVAVNLQQTPVNYKPQALLYVSKFFYNLCATAKPFTTVAIDCVREYDARLAGRKFVSLEDYSAMVADINVKLGGRHG